MRYKNASDILPQNVLELIQEYTDGVYIYIPRKEENRKQWGDNTHTKAEIQERNASIYAQYKSGQKVQELAREYFLSEKSIERVITHGRKQELVQLVQQNQ